MQVDFYMNELPDNERQAFATILTIIRNECKVPESVISKSTVYRFLKSKNFNIAEAKTEILDHVAWRQSKNWTELADIDTEIWNFVFTGVKIGYIGEDSYGRPIRIVQPQDVDLTQFFVKYGPEVFERVQIGMMERLVNIILESCSRKNNKLIHSIISIVYVKHVQVSKILTNSQLISFMKSKSAVFQKNYPELAHRAIIINAGSVFYTLWKVISLFINKNTLEKIQILNTGYFHELLKITTIDNIPAELNGTSPYEIDNYPNHFDQQMYQSFLNKRLT